MDESEPITQPSTPDLSPVVIHLFKGVLYQDADPSLWAALVRIQPQVREYVRVVGLELVLDEAEGHAFLRSFGDTDAECVDAGRPLPRLIARRRLSFPVSLLLALLRKRMAEADAGGGSTRLMLTRGEIVSLMRVFLAESSNEAGIIDQIENHIGKVEALGFLRKLKSESVKEEPGYEVMRILKAFVDAQWLAGFDERLAEYARHAAGKEGGADA